MDYGACVFAFYLSVVVQEMIVYLVFVIVNRDIKEMIGGRMFLCAQTVVY
jgi:hypothetical protein